MLLLGFKNQMIGWLMLYITIAFIPLAFSADLIHPFLITPSASIEKYNYAAGIVDKIQPCLLLYVLYSSLSFLGLVNVDSTINNWIKKSTQDVSKVVLVVFFYQVKELCDYLLFENVVPCCISQFWFLILWELLPIVIIMVWAILNTKERA